MNHPKFTLFRFWHYPKQRDNKRLSKMELEKAKQFYLQIFPYKFMNDLRMLFCTSVSFREFVSGNTYILKENQQ